MDLLKAKSNEGRSPYYVIKGPLDLDAGMRGKFRKSRRRHLMISSLTTIYEILGEARSYGH